MTMQYFQYCLMVSAGSFRRTGKSVRKAVVGLLLMFGTLFVTTYFINSILAIQQCEHLYEELLGRVNVSLDLTKAKAIGKVLFLAHLHPILMRQKLAFTIFVINQTDSKPFNRGMLLNVGFTEARRRSTFDCFVLHDVDMLPEDDRNLCMCSEMPRHCTVTIEKFGYNDLGPTFFGGGIALTAEQMVKLNGFSNQFWGWGGEDDEMYKRVIARNYSITRYPPEIARYATIQHEQAPMNPDRKKILKASMMTQDTDGLNNLEYFKEQEILKPLYTEIHVHLRQVAPGSGMNQQAMSLSEEIQTLQNLNRKKKQFIGITGVM